MSALANRGKNDVLFPNGKFAPWKYTCFGGHSEIEVYVEATDRWETLAVVNAVDGWDAEDLASFIADTVNEQEKAAQQA